VPGYVAAPADNVEERTRTISADNLISSVTRELKTGKYRQFDSRFHDCVTLWGLTSNSISPTSWEQAKVKDTCEAVKG